MEKRSYSLFDNVSENSSDEETDTSNEDSSEESTDSEFDEILQCELCLDGHSYEACGENLYPVFNFPDQKCRQSADETDMTLDPQTRDDQKICSKVINAYTDVLEHKIKCNQWVTSCTTTASRNAHNSRIHGNIPLFCGDCQQICSTKGELRFHKAIHDGAPTTCKECGKILRNKENLRIHERIHTDKRPFICSICGRGFSQQYSMRVHEMNHDHRTDKPFQCDICAKSFKSNISCIIHMKRCCANSAVQSQVPSNNYVPSERSIDQEVLPISLQQNVNPSANSGESTSQLPIQNGNQVVASETDNSQSRTNKNQESNAKQNHHFKK